MKPTRPSSRPRPDRSDPASLHEDEIRESLLEWFAHGARTFPWRDDRDPYRVWVAEIMLQQTRAQTVVPYFERWMARFPTVEAVAAADEQEVLALWEGLGYYRRARALHAAARHVRDELGGRLPTDEDGWRSLPGVGRYTAAAVTAFAYGARTVAVDGNVRRVGARLLAEEAPGPARLAAALETLLPVDRPGRATEALIELGATLCTPRNPSCTRCPLRSACGAYAEGEPERYPAPARRARPARIVRFAAVRVGPPGVWLERRPPDGLLGGLWGFPQSAERPPGRTLPSVDHAYSHFRLRLVPVVVPADGERIAEPSARWVTRAERVHLPLSRVDRIVLDRLEQSGLLRCEA